MKVGLWIRSYFYHSYIRIESLKRWGEYRVTTRGWFLFYTALLILLPSMSMRHSLAYQFLSLCVCFAVVSLFALKNYKPKIVANRMCSEVTRIGESFHYVIRIENGSDQGMDGLGCYDIIETPYPDKVTFLAGYERDTRNVVDRFLGYPRFSAMLDKNKAAELKPVLNIQLQAGEVKNVKMEAVFKKRGFHKFIGTKWMKEESLGLIRSRAFLKEETGVWVFPKKWDNLNWKSVWFKSSESDEKLLKHKKGDPEQFHHLREYQPGDSPKYIDWKSSAKLDHFVVKSYFQECGESVGIVIDTFQRKSKVEEWEAMLSWICTCLADQIGQKVEVHIVILGETSQVHLFDGSLPSWKHCMKSISALEPLGLRKMEGREDQFFSALKNKMEWSWLGLEGGEEKEKIWSKLSSRSKRFRGIFISESESLAKPKNFDDCAVFQIGQPHANIGEKVRA